MTITNTDIVLFQSQNNTDNNNGGGSRINTPVADGAVNNLFPDISRIDTVLGDVAMRKVFPVVNTNNRDIYYGAHSIIRKTPDDPQVSALLFSTDSAIDVRSQAQSDVESYLIPSYQASFYLFGVNIQSAKAVTFLQRVEEVLPTVGDVYVLQEGNLTQYIRISDIDHTEIKIFFSGTDYTRRRIIATIEQGLTNTFTGSAFSPTGQLANTCDTFATQVADAAKFYGTKNVALDATQGDTFLELDSIYEQLVPATTQQSGIINRQALQSVTMTVVDSNDLPVAFRVTAKSSSPIQTFPTSITPGSLTSNGINDDGNGRLYRTSGGGDFEGFIDYVTGTLQYISGNNPLNNTLMFYTPTSKIDALIQYSIGTLITTENQGSVYIQSLSPVPTPGNIYIDYRNGDKWYRISGNTDGSIGDADDGLGAGLVSNNNNGTATVSVTLGAVPDVGSTVIFSWGSVDAMNAVKSEVEDSAIVYFEWKLPHENIDPDNCTIVYQDNRGGSIQSLVFSSTALTQTAGAATLEFTLQPEKGILTASPIDGANGLPGTDITSTNVSNFMDLSYNYANEPAVGATGERKFITNPVLTFVSSTGQYSHDLGITIKDSGLQIKFTGSFSSNSMFGRNGAFTKTLTSDINGILRESPDGEPLGNVTTNGLVTISMPNVVRNKPVLQVINGITFAKYTQSATPLYSINSVQFIEYNTESITTYDQSHSESEFRHYLNCYLKINLLPNIVSGFMIEPYGVDNFTQTGRTIFITGDEVYQDLDNPVQIGTIDRYAGELVLEFWKTTFQGNTNSFSNNFKVSNMSVLADEPVNNIRRQVFRTGSSNLVTSSLILRYSTSNGTFTATSDANGVITGTDINTTDSYVDTTNGTVFVVFTSDLIPESIRFDAVAETTLPLDPALLGLNPIRLPPDGRVPVFYPGSIIVIFNEETTSITTTPVADAVETLARAGQAYIEVIDVNGQRLAYDQFVADKTAGTVTFANPLSLIDRSGDALTAPYSIVDRVEDMTICVDASVTGRINIAAPLSRDYLAGQTKVASALVWGDIGSRTHNLFTQSSFDVWSDQLTQALINSQFDDINYPIQINNKDSFTGRWALVFTSNTTVDVIEESLGVVLEDAPINADIAPVNPATGLPYFTILTGGWGGGWVTSNLFRFNTESGSENMWVIRTVQSGALTEQVDSIDVEIRGDVN